MSDSSGSDEADFSSESAADIPIEKDEEDHGPTKAMRTIMRKERKRPTSHSKGSRRLCQQDQLRAPDDYFLTSHRVPLSCFSD